MAQVPFHHLIGTNAWWRCDHAGTSLDPAQGVVRLATEEEGDAASPVPPEVIAAWLALRGGLVLADRPPDQCGGPCWVRFSPDGAVSELREAWEPIGAFSACASASRDRCGRIWLLEQDRVRILSADTLRIIATIDAPVGAVSLACADDGVLAAGSGALWWMAWGKEWVKLDLRSALQTDRLAWDTLVPGAQVRAVGAQGGVGFLLLGDPALLIVLHVAENRAWLHPLVGLEGPIALLALSPTEVLVGEVSAAPPSPVRFGLYQFAPGQPLTRTGTRDVIRWDGIGLALSTDGAPVGTIASGVRAFTRVRERYGWIHPTYGPLTRGRVETWAFDSERYGCHWHRVFLDACVPVGTSIRVEAKTSDALPWTARAPAPPVNLGKAAPNLGTRVGEVPQDTLGSQTEADDEGWVDVGALDKRAFQVDVPGFRPWSTGGFVTLEGLIKSAPGRYLWLRLNLMGTVRATPQLLGVRVSFPRPSLLDLLPAFWRADPTVAARMEETLALFEGAYTEQNGRLDALPALFDPSVTPALEWLASWVALTLDPRLPEHVQRALLAETAALYRRRGTVSGLERLLSILGECPVRVLEAWRMRRRIGAMVQAEGASSGAVIGPGLQIGGPEGFYGDTDRSDWELELEAAWKARNAARKAAIEAGIKPCPPVQLPDPIERDPLRAWYGRYAHRFSVLLFRAHDADRAAVIGEALEANKPAHTVHDLCWIGEGFRVGVNTLVGLGTVLGDTTRTQPFVVGDGTKDPLHPDLGPLGTPLGPPQTLSRPHPASALSLLVGAARVGQTTLTG